MLVPSCYGDGHKDHEAQNVIHDLASLCGWRSAKKKDRYRHGPHRNASE
jgi:hypothetical protein